MKKFLEAGKLWTVLSTLLFFMTCGIFIVHATGSSSTGYFSNTYKTGAINNTLTDTGWNKLMGDLDKLVPEGAVMAFLTENCPDGWTPFTGANEGRFLMGANSNIGAMGGNNTITITGGQLPEHQHKIKYRNRGKIGTNSAERGIIVDWDTNNVPDGVYLGAGSWATQTYSINTAPSGNGNPINILNPYIKVRYCVKGSYTANTHTINFTYNDRYGKTESNSINALMGTSITFGNYGNQNYVTIGTSKVYAQPENGAVFVKWTNHCNNTLTSDCTIDATFKRDSTCSFFHQEDNCRTNGNCNTMCRNRVYSSTCVDAGSVSSCTYGGDICTCTYNS